MKKQWIPNLITSLRLFGAIALLFLPALEPAFFVVYTLCGLSDLFDGLTARLFHAESDFGSKLDSVADLLFYAAMLLKTLPVLWTELPQWIWLYLAAILTLRLCAYLVAAIRYRRFASLHTYLNKATGLGVFLLPYWIGRGGLVPFAAVVCSVAALASAEEFILHARSSAYDPNRKSLFF